jgi:hypothetical protein
MPSPVSRAAVVVRFGGFRLGFTGQWQIVQFFGDKRQRPFAAGVLDRTVAMRFWNHAAHRMRREQHLPASQERGTVAGQKKGVAARFGTDIANSAFQSR